MVTYKVTFEPDGKTVTIEEGKIIAEAVAAGEINIHIDAPCGGEGLCGKCKVIVDAQDLEPLTEAEEKFLSEEELDEGYRLACQLPVTCDMTVTIPEDLRLAESKILSDGMEQEVKLHPNIFKVYAELSEQTLDNQIADLTSLQVALGLEELTAELDVMRKLPSVIRDSKFKVTAVLDGNRLIDIEPGDTSDKKYGLAVDIGTTTVVCTVVDLNTGSDIGVASALNNQAVHGADVISRINYSAENENGLTDLRDRVVQVINQLSEYACTEAGISLENVYEVSLVGNTTMTHLFLAIPVRNLAVMPYVGVVSDPVETTASHLGIKVNPNANVYVLPNIAGFVGADTVGVILAADLHKSEDIKLAIDIGTNGEVVLGSKDRLVTCSCAAGPALEGAMLTHGMRAAPGAIERVKLNDKPECQVIKGGKPIGICGSGIIDVVAEMVRVGIIDETGRMMDADDLGDKVSPEMKEYLGNNDEYGPHLVLSKSDGREVVITQKDVRQVQLAKGAIMAGIKILIKTLGVKVEDISEVLLAGAFGNYIQRESAIRLGLIPDFPLEKVKFIGNAAAGGAKMALMSREARKTSKQISKKTEYIELAVDMNFQNEFVEAMMFG